jgi:glycosyltransferase involved in cell wall biosynthesis
VYGSANVESDFARERAVGSGRVRRLLARKVEELERRAATTSDLIFACTDRDARRFEELYPGSDVAVVPNGFDDDLLSLDRARLRESARADLGVADGERLVVFIGGAADHNLRAVEFIERELASRLDRGTRLLVAGKAAVALSDHSGPTLSLGFVDDVKPLLAAADVALNPVPYGSGSNVKIAEYLAAGLPVVTTPIGARGFERWSDRMRVAELDDFAEAIERSSPPGPPPAGIEELGWNRIAAQLHALYSQRMS